MFFSLVAESAEPDHQLLERPDDSSRGCRPDQRVVRRTPSRLFRGMTPMPASPQFQCRVSSASMVSVRRANVSRSGSTCRRHDGKQIVAGERALEEGQDRILRGVRSGERHMEQIQIDHEEPVAGSLLGGSHRPPTSDRAGRRQPPGVRSARTRRSQRSAACRPPTPRSRLCSGPRPPGHLFEGRHRR